MPDSVRETILNQVWAVLEADAAVAALFTKAANRQRAGKEGGLRNRIASSPNDFPNMTVDLPRGNHSMWSLADTASFAGEDADFHTQTTIDFDVDQAIEIAITVYQESPEAGQVNSPEGAIIPALFATGTRLGLPDLIVTIGKATWDRRKTRAGEMPENGEVTTIRVPVQTKQSGRALLAT